VTSISELDLAAFAREIAAPKPPPEPSPELVAKAGAYLERRGWTHELAGEELAERYTARLTSRIKELCIPLHIRGADKRRWAKGSKQLS